MVTHSSQRAGLFARDLFWWMALRCARSATPPCAVTLQEPSTADALPSKNGLEVLPGYPKGIGIRAALLGFRPAVEFATLFDTATKSIAE